MKPCFPLFSASLAILALAACSPSTPASDASASVSETAAETVAAADTTEDTSDTVVAESVASSAATVVVTQAETYDPVVIRQMGQKPGYWEVKHTDPKTRKSYVTHVCVDKPLGAKMTKQGPVSPPSNRRDYKDDANFMGACPAGVQGGDVQKSDGNRVNAYGDHKPGQSHDINNKSNDGDAHGDNRDAQKPSAGNNQSHVSAEPSHNPHTTPAEDHANDQRHDSSSARPGEGRE